MAATSALLIQIRADASQAVSQLHALEGGLKPFSALGSAALPASLALAGAGAAITAGFGGAVRTAAEFDSHLTAVRNNTTMTNADMEVMRATVLKLGASAPVPLSQLADGFMHVTNFGFSAKDSVQILDAAMKSAVSTGGDTAKTAEVLAAVMKEFSIPAAKAAETIDIIHTAAAEGNMTLEQFTTSFGQVAAWASAVGVPLDQAAAAFSALTRHGFDASEAGTQVKDMIAHLINPSQEALKAVSGLGRAVGQDLTGVMTPAFVHAHGLSGVLDTLSGAMKQAGMSGDAQTQMWMKLIPNIRGGAAAFILAGNGASDYTNILGDTHKALGMTEQAFDRMRATAGFQWGVLTNRMQELGIALGSVLLPPLTVIVGALSMAAGWFAQLPTPIVTVLGYVGALAGIALTAAGTLGLLAFTLPKLMVGFQALGAIMGIVRTAALAAASGTAGAWLAAAAPVLLVIGAIVAAGAGLYLAWQNNFLGIRDIVASVVNFVADKIAGLMDWLAEHNLLGVGQNWREGWQKIKDDAGSGVHGVGDAIKSALDGMTGAVVPDVDTFIHDVNDKLTRDLPATAADAATKTAKAAKEAADEALKATQDATTTRKLNFEMAHVEAERDVLTTKLDQTVAESQLVDYKRQIEDLDRNAIDYARKRLELDEQDAVTKAKIAESSLKARDEDLSYEQKLIKAQLIASRHGGPAMDRSAARAELRDLHTQQILTAPALLVAEHNTALANRAKEGTDLQGSLVKTELDRRKLAIEEQMAPYEKQAVLARRAAEDFQRALDLEKQRFQITESSRYEKDRLQAELDAKDAERNLYTVEHSAPVTVNVGGITVVNNGDPGDTARLHQTVVDAVTQAARDAKQSGKAAVSPRLGGAGYGLT